MADNLIFDSARQLSVVCSNPTTPSSGDPVRYGSLCGVAVTDERTDGTTTVDFGPAVYDLSVKGVNDSGNSAVAVGDALFYVDADTPKISKKQSGYYIGTALETVNSAATGTIRVMVGQAVGSGAIASDGVTTTKILDDAVTTAKIADNNITTALLTATLGTGFIPLDITTMKIIGSNVIGNTTEGLFPDGNTTPLLERENAATDIALRVHWAKTVVTELQFAPIPKPPDLDGAAALTFHMMIAKDANTDTTAVIGVKIFDGIGDTNAGGNTAALATGDLTEYTVTLAAGDLAEAPGFLNISVTPGTHANDAEYLYAAWIEYTRK